MMMMNAFFLSAAFLLASVDAASVEEKKFAITTKSYSIYDTATLQTACKAEFGLQAHTIDLDTWKEGATWREMAKDLPTLQRFTHYWALGSSDYLDATSNSKGVVVEYLWGDNVLPVLMGDAEMPSFLKVQVLCQGAGSGSNVASPATIKASSYGHLHIQTWSGDKMDFKRAGNCDLVLVDNPQFLNGLGLQIQVQTKSTPLWSYIDSAVVQIGTDKLQVRGGDYWVNGVYRANLEFSSNFPVTLKEVNARQSDFVVDYGDGNAISVKTFHHYVRVDLLTAPTANVFVGSVGLMGSFPDGLWVGRDSVLEDRQEFAKEWIVEDHKSLFETPSDNSQCQLKIANSRSSKPKKPEAELEEDQDYFLSPVRALRRRLTEWFFDGTAIRGMTETDAQEACGRAHGNVERIPACVEGLMEMVAAQKSNNHDEEEGDGALADVYHALNHKLDAVYHKLSESAESAEEEQEAMDF